MTTVNQLLQNKGPDVWTASPDISVFEALQLMADKNIGALLILEDEKLCGVMSERDYARKVVLHEKSALTTPVKDIMTTRVYCVEPECTMAECMALMTEQRVRHLPVLTGNQVMGVVSIGDIVKEIISEQEFMIEQLESYISSGG